MERGVSRVGGGKREERAQHVVPLHGAGGQVITAKKKPAMMSSEAFQ